MLRTLLATTAVAALMAIGAQAQETTSDPEATTPLVVPETPTTEGTEAGATAPAESMADDPAAKPPSDTMAQEPAAETPADTMAQEPTAETPADTMAQEPATETPADTMAAEPAAPTDAVPLEEGWSEVDIATISTDSLIGSDIRTYDQETVASIQDVLLSPDGQAESVVARFGGILGFGETTVLVTMDEITVVKDADGNMLALTNLTPEALKDRPEYEEVEG